MQGAQGTILPIPYLAGGYDASVAQNISDDGQTLVGYVDITGVGNSRSGWYWNTVEGTVEVPKLTGNLQMELYDCSADGSYIVGKCRNNDTDAFETPIRWDAANGTIDLFSGSGLHALAVGISADGTRVIGRGSPSGSPPNPSDGFLWHEGVGVIPLEVPPDPFGADPSPCKPYCISGDGSVVGGAYDKFFGGAQTFPPVLWSGVDGSIIDVLTGTPSAFIKTLNYDASFGIGIKTSNPTANYVDLSKHGKTLLASNLGANTMVSWAGGSTVSSITHAAFSTLVRIPIAATVLGTSVPIMPETGNVIVSTAGNGLMYATRRADPAHPAQSQSVRVTLLVRHDYP